MPILTIMGGAIVKLARQMGYTGPDLVALTPLQITQDDRDAAKAKGLALPDGSFPCDTPEKLDHAIQSWGRCPPEHRSALKALMNRAADKLGAGDDVKQRIAALQA